MEIFSVFLTVVMLFIHEIVSFLIRSSQILYLLDNLVVVLEGQFVLLVILIIYK